MINYTLSGTSAFFSQALTENFAKITPVNKIPKYS